MINMNEVRVVCVVFVVDAQVFNAFLKANVFFGVFFFGGGCGGTRRPADAHGTDAHGTETPVRGAVHAEPGGGRAALPQLGRAGQ